MTVHALQQPRPAARPPTPLAQSLTVEEVLGLEDFLRLGPEWEALAARDARGLPFLRHDWTHLWLRHFAPESFPRLLTVRHGGRLVAVLPLLRLPRSLRRLGVGGFASPTNPHSCRFDVLADPEVPAGTLAERLWSHLRDQRDWEVLELRDVPDDGVAPLILECARRDGFRAERWASQVSPYIPIDSSLQTFESTLSPKLRSNLRRRARNLARRGVVSFDRFAPCWSEPRDPQAARSARLQAGLEEHLAEGLALELAGWKGRAGTAMAVEAPVREFYQSLSQLAAERGWLRLYSLRLDRKMIAFQLGLSYGGRYFLLKPAYDEAHGDCSPGQLLLQEVLRDLHGEGVGELDFLGPMMTWKRDWTDAARSHHWLYVFADTPRARLFHGTKFLLKPWLDGQLGQVRRQLSELVHEGRKLTGRNGSSSSAAVGERAEVNHVDL